MKPCDRWRDELADHVAGARASAALTAHLEACPACAAAANAWRARMREIDAGLQEWGTTEPPASAVPRILASVRAQAAERRWFWEWRPAAAGVLALVIVAFASVYVRRTAVEREEENRTLYAATAIGSWRSPTQGLMLAAQGVWPKGSPQLGGFFFPWKTEGAEKETERQ